jgi:hypothetical protein
MFSFNYDPTRLVLVAVATGLPKSDADYEQLVAQIDQLDRQGKAQNKAIGYVIAVDPESPAPSAKWRRRFVEQRKGMTSPRVLMSLVAQSAVARGVMTAMNWISPDPPHVRSLTHASFAESASWIELTQGTPRDVLHKMHGEALSRCPKPARAS